MEGDEQCFVGGAGAQESEAKEDASDSHSGSFSGSMNPFRLANNLAPTGGDSDRIKAHTMSALLRYNSSPCAFGTDRGARVADVSSRGATTITAQLSDECPWTGQITEGSFGDCVGVNRSLGSVDAPQQLHGTQSGHHL